MRWILETWKGEAAVLTRLSNLSRSEPDMTRIWFTVPG